MRKYHCLFFPAAIGRLSHDSNKVCQLARQNTPTECTDGLSRCYCQYITYTCPLSLHQFWLQVTTSTNLVWLQRYQWYRKNKQAGKHLIKFWTITVTLTLNTALQSFHHRLWLMVMYQQTKFGCWRGKEQVLSLHVSVLVLSDWLITTLLIDDWLSVSWVHKLGPAILAKSIARSVRLICAVWKLLIHLASIISSDSILCRI